MIVALHRIVDDQRSMVGGKGYALGQLIKRGYRVPKGFCVTAEAYRQYIHETGLGDLVRMELNRKELGEMRWEEIWDTSLRIRSHFLRTEIPGSIKKKIEKHLVKHCATGKFAVRSSSPEEDASLTSFAGLHDSYIGLQGTDSIIHHIKLVWASLWSNRALLYRRELNLDPSSSSMAVVIQKLIEGDVSGIAFSRNPNDSAQSVIEAVYGLNQALVDGTIEPDRWFIDRSSDKITNVLARNRSQYQVSSASGLETKRLPSNLAGKPPLTEGQLARLYETAIKLEILFQAPQDIEWTYRDGELFILQTRPITAAKSLKKEDKRLWYFSLQRSFENLQQLHHRIESVLLPEMAHNAERLEKIELSILTDKQLAGEIEQRENIFQYWRSVYWDEFIPFAHGVRLFGEFYNDTIQPEDPGEFTKLLAGSQMISLSRNDMLQQLASMIQSNPLLAKELKARKLSAPVCRDFMTQLENFYPHFSGLSWKQSLCFSKPEDILKLLLEWAKAEKPVSRRSMDETIQLKKNYLNRFHGPERDFAARLLELACASYRLRDDDNIYLGKVESQLIRSVEEGKRRIETRNFEITEPLSNEEVQSLLKDSNFIPKKKRRKNRSKKKTRLRARQIIGQPASPGFASGPARVIKSGNQICDIKSGEVLVCEAIDPNMTFIAPLSSAIVETRGGMLIHGAIIAREYGLPCVTGIPEATQRIKTGDTISVDGYLGIVTIQRV